MVYRVDVSDEYQRSKSRVFRYTLLFSLCLTFTLLTDALLIILTKGDYIVSLSIAIVVTVLFSWFAIYFFTNMFNDVNAYYRFFKSYESGIKATEEVEVIKKDDELTLVNGLYVYPIYIKCFDGLTIQEKIIYTLDKNYKYLEGCRYTITTYQRIIIEAENHL